MITQRPSPNEALGLMEAELHDLPNILKKLGAYILANSENFDQSGFTNAKRLCVVGHGSNLLGARILDRSFAKRNIGARFADPRNAICLDDELLIGITRTAANDNIMDYLEKHDRPSMLLTANPTSDHIPKRSFVLDLQLGPAKPIVATQSVFSLVMMLDAFFTLQNREQCVQNWLAFAERLPDEIAHLQAVAARQAKVISLSERLFLIGDKILEDIARSLAWTIMETSNLPCNVIPLTAGRKGPMMQLGSTDCVMLIGREGNDKLFAQYRRKSGYSLSLMPPPYTKELGVGLYSLLQGQFLALELSRLRGI